MKQQINRPTRVTLTTSTLLDVILSTDHRSHALAGVYETGVSDHYMVYTVYSKWKAHIKPTGNETQFRNYKNFNTDRFRDELLSKMSMTDVNWTPYLLWCIFVTFTTDLLHNLFYLT